MEEVGDDDDDDNKEEGDVEVRKTRKNSLAKKNQATQKASPPPPPPPPPEYNHTAFVELNTFIPQGKSGKEVLPLWEDAIMDLLDFVHQMDPSFCIILPHSDAKESRIYERKDFPKFFRTWKTYVHYENDVVMGMPTDKTRSRKVVATIRFGFDEDPESFLNDIRVDMAAIEDVRLYYKKVQAWHTKKDFMLFYGPTSPPMQIICDEVLELLAENEKLFVSQKPNQFPADLHDGAFPVLFANLDWARGGNFVDRPVGVQEDTSHRKVPTFMYDFKDGDRIMKVMRECKRLGKEAKVFGQHAFFQETPDKYADKPTKDRYGEKVINHGAVQKSLGQVTLSGLCRPDYKVIVELHPDAKGPRASPGSYSVRDILTKMSGAGKIRLWQCIIQNRNGGYDGYFPGTDPMATKRASELADDPSGYLKCFLLRQGWTMGSIKKLICKSFDEESARNANLARWDRKLNKVISGGDVLHAEHNAALDASFINRDLGRTDYERSQDVKNATSAGGAEVNMSDLGAGSFGAFEFGEDQSAKTTRTAKSAKTYQLDAQSQFTIETNADVGWDEESKMGDRDEEMRNVEIELPLGGIDTSNTATESLSASVDSSEVDSMTSKVEVVGVIPAPARMDERSVQSNIAPSDLLGKFGARREGATTAGEDVGDASMKENEEEDTNQVPTTTKESGKSTTVGDLERKLHAMMKQLTEVQSQLQAEQERADSPANVSNPEDGIVNRTDINAASGSRGAEQQALGHENPSNADGETQETGERADVPSRPG